MRGGAHAAGVDGWKMLEMGCAWDPDIGGMVFLQLSTQSNRDIWMMDETLSSPHLKEWYVSHSRPDTVPSTT